MTRVFGLKGTGRGQRRLLVALAVAVAMLIPAAIAWACNPQAFLTLDKTTYRSGENVRVSGSFFQKNSPVQLDLIPGGRITTVTTDENGSFGAPEGTFKLADSQPEGAYTVQSTATTPSGTFRAKREILVKNATSSPPTTPGSPAPPRTEQPAPSDERFTEPGFRESFREPGFTGSPRDREPALTRSSGDDRKPALTRSSGDDREPAATPRSRNRGGEDAIPRRERRRSSDSGTVSGRSGPPAQADTGRDVFADSTTPAQRAGSTTTPADSSTATLADSSTADRGGRKVPTAPTPSPADRPSERAAVGDLWGGFGAGRSPSLAPRAADGAPDDGPGSQLTWGLGLLGLGLLGLLSGLAVAEARRRRVMVGR